MIYRLRLDNPHNIAARPLAWRPIPKSGNMNAASDNGLYATNRYGSITGIINRDILEVPISSVSQGLTCSGSKHFILLR